MGKKVKNKTTNETVNANNASKPEVNVETSGASVTPPQPVVEEEKPTDSENKVNETTISVDPSVEPAGTTIHVPVNPNAETSGIQIPINPETFTETKNMTENKTNEVVNPATVENAKNDAPVVTNEQTAAPNQPAEAKAETTVEQQTAVPEAVQTAVKIGEAAAPAEEKKHFPLWAKAAIGLVALSVVGIGVFAVAKIKR